MQATGVASRSAALALLVLIVGCSNTTGRPTAVDSPTTEPAPRTSEMTLHLTSPAFAEGGAIPSDYTCDGQNLQLPVQWSGAPAGTTEFALIMDDPDARGFVHWVVTGIPADVTGLADPLPAGAVQGRNDFGRAGYGGPCPPSGTHTYVVTLYALSAPLGLTGASTAAAVRSAAATNTLATAVIRGTYRRSR